MCDLRRSPCGLSPAAFPKSFSGTAILFDSWQTSMACRWEKVALPTS